MSFCVGHYIFKHFLLSFTMENSLKQFGENSKNFLCDVHKQRKLQTWVICPQNIDLDLAKMEIGNEQKKFAIFQSLLKVDNL